MAGLPQWPPYLSHPHYPALRPPPPPPHRLPGAGDLEGREDKEHGAGHTPAGASGALWAQAQHSLTSFLGTMHQIAEEDRKTAAPAVAPEDATAAIEELRQQMEEMAEQASTAAAELQVECTDAAAEAKSFAEQGLSDVHERLQRVEDEMRTLRAETSSNAQLQQETEARNVATGQKLARLERALQSAEERWRTEAAWRAAEATVAAALTPAPAPALRGDRDEATDTWSIPVLADSSCSESLASDHGSAPLEWPEADRPEVPPAEAGLEVPPAQPIPGVFDSLFDDDKFPVLAAAESDIVVLTDPKDGYVYPALHRSGADLLCALWDGTLAESRKMAVELWADEVRAAPLPLSEELFNPPFDFEHAAEHHTPRPAPLADAAPSVSPQKAAGGADAAPAAKTPPAAAQAATSPKALNPVQAARAAAAPDAERSSAAKDFAAAAGAPPPPHPDGSSPSPDDPSVAAAKPEAKKEKEGVPGLDANRRVTTVDEAVTAAGELLKGNEWFVGIRLEAKDKLFGLLEVGNQLFLEGAGPAYRAGVREGMTVLSVADMGTSRYYCLKVDGRDNLQGTFKRDAASEGRNCGKIHLPYSLFIKNMYTQLVWNYPTLLVSTTEGRGIMDGQIVDTGVHPYSAKDVTKPMTFANAEDVHVAQEPVDNPTVWHYRGSSATSPTVVSSAAKAPVPAAPVPAEKASLQHVDVVKSGRQSALAADNMAKNLLQARPGELAAILEVVPLSDFKLSKTPTQTIVSSVEKGSKAQEWGLQVNMPVLSWHASTSTCTLYVLLGDCELPGVCKTLNAVKVVEFVNAKLLAKRPTDAGFEERTTASVNKCAVKEKDVVYAKLTTHANTATKKFYINVASSRMRKEWMRPRFTKGGLKTADGVVTAVEPKSGAWKAGLRKGMKVVSRKDEKGDGGHVNLVVEAL